MRIVVRQATERDYAVAGDICVSAYREDGQLNELPGIPSYAPALADVAGRAVHGDVLVAVDDGSGDVVGCVTFAEPGSPYAEISKPGEAEFRMLAVAPAAQGRGVGRALVAACLDLASARGYTAVAICVRDVNETARRMYAGFGFARIPERDWSPRPDIDLFALRLELDPAAVART